jgi:hypothetical protein
LAHPHRTGGLIFLKTIMETTDVDADIALASEKGDVGWLLNDLCLYS